MNAFQTKNAFQTVLLSPPNRIGDLEIPAIFEEIHVNTLRVTEHPVELGAAITDHAYVRPQEVIIKCGWSNSTLATFVSAIRSLNDQTGSSANSSARASDYVSSVYDKLKALHEKRTPLYLFTGLREYTDMLITGLRVTRDEKTSHALMVEVHCRQIFIVKTLATKLPAKAHQAYPSKTAAVENMGVKQLIKRTPMSGGAVSLDKM